MNTRLQLSRRRFLKRSGIVGLGIVSATPLQLVPSGLRAAGAPSSASEWIGRIADPEIRAGVEAAVFKNLLPAATERIYSGHFTINADGSLKYCEYAAVLARVVFANRELFL